MGKAGTTRKRRFILSQKITFEDVYLNFKQVYPRLSKRAASYKPYGYLSILICFVDGSNMIFDYAQKRGKYITNN